MMRNLQAKTMSLMNIRDYKMIIVCAVLLVMVILCGMSEARMAGDIQKSLPSSMGTLQGFAVVDQLHL